MIWREFDGTEPKDGTQILTARFNGCGMEYYVVWWAGDCAYPWQSDHNSYPEDRFDEWTLIDGPKGYE